MGGVTKFPYPAYVWSPAGGWWRDTKGTWSRALVVLAGASAALVGLTFNKARSLEEWSRAGAFSQPAAGMAWNNNPKSPHWKQL